MLMCEDVQASIGFYTNVLGFEVTGRMDDVGRSGFAALRNGAAAIMLASPSYIPTAPRVDDRYPQSHYYLYVYLYVYFYVGDAEALRQSVVDISALRRQAPSTARRTCRKVRRLGNPPRRSANSRGRP